MLRKLVPLVLALIGLGAGIGAGMALRPAPVVAATDAPAADPATEAKSPTAAAANPAQEMPVVDEKGVALFDYVKLNNQFVVPVVQDGNVDALVVMSLSLEVTVGSSDQVHALEPKLRDAFLRVLFDHANSGGFAADFTDTNSMVVVRDALRETAVKILGALVTDILITDLIRQNV